MDSHWGFGKKTNSFATLTRVFFSQTSTQVHQILIPTHNHEVTPYHLYTERVQWLAQLQKCIQHQADFIQDMARLVHFFTSTQHFVHELVKVFPRTSPVINGMARIQKLRHERILFGMAVQDQQTKCTSVFCGLVQAFSRISAVMTWISRIQKLHNMSREPVWGSPQVWV